MADHAISDPPLLDRKGTQCIHEGLNVLHHQSDCTSQLKMCVLMRIGALQQPEIARTVPMFSASELLQGPVYTQKTNYI